MSLSIVLPCYNEAPNIVATIKDVHAYLQTVPGQNEIIAVNDGSKDETGSILHSLMADYAMLKVIDLPENKGYGNAVITGLDAATCDYIAFMDSDGQFKAEHFATLLPHTNTYQIVTGRRIRRADPLIRSINAFLYGTLVKVALRVYIRDINCAMKIFKREIWPTIRPSIASGALVNAEIFLRAKGAKIAWKQVPVPHYPRTAGQQTGAKISVILRMFMELFQLKKKYMQEQRSA
jgi:glycosyltransferase involved in cell wall biosynthesis